MPSSWENPAAATPPNPALRAVDRDLGFGSLAMRPHYRLLNRDGSFNVRRLHEGWLDRLFAYHTLIGLSWPVFLALFAFWYVAVNALFALGYLALGVDALRGSYEGTLFWRDFFFSVHTFATVAGGHDALGADEHGSIASQNSRLRRGGRISKNLHSRSAGADPFAGGGAARH